MFARGRFMTDVWYYADGEEPRGPFSIGDLVALLAQMADPRRTMIWQHGFDDWKAVEDVREVAQQVFRPPPLGRRPPPPPEQLAPTIREPAVTVENAAEFKDVRPELMGLGGWLALVGLGQVSGILKFAASMAKYYSEVDAQLWTRFPTAMWGEAALNAALFWVFVYSAVLFFRRSRLFPKFFVWQFVVAFCSPFLGGLWAWLAIGLTAGRPIKEFIPLDPKEGGQLIAVLITAAIWIPYIRKSRRVRNTFTA